MSERVEPPAGREHWVQPVCEADWQQLAPGVTPARRDEPKMRVCCLCGSLTESGIFVFVDPSTLPYPQVP